MIQPHCKVSPSYLSHIEIKSTSAVGSWDGFKCLCLRILIQGKFLKFLGRLRCFAGYTVGYLRTHPYAKAGRNTSGRGSVRVASFFIYLSTTYKAQAPNARDAQRTKVMPFTLMVFFNLVEEVRESKIVIVDHGECHEEKSNGVCNCKESGWRGLVRRGTLGSDLQYEEPAVQRPEGACP